MRKYLLGFFFLIAASSLFAQDLQVIVRDQQGALPFAVVSVNHTQHFMCDSLGQALLPVASLNSGDTISSSYIGKRPAFALYAEESGSPCVLTHEADEVYEMGNVEVVPEKANGWKMFRKCVKTYFYVLFDCLMEGTFQAEVTLPGHPMRQAGGTFSIENKIPRQVGHTAFHKYYFNFQPQLQTPDDTSGIGLHLSEAIRHTIRTSNRTVGNIYAASVRKGVYMSMYYLGVNQDQHVFRYVYADGKSSFQILFRANVQTQQIERLDYCRIDCSGDKVRQWDMSMTCAMVKWKKSGPFSQLAFPQHIRSSYTRDDGTRISLELDGVTCELRERERGK